MELIMRCTQEHGLSVGGEKYLEYHAEKQPVHHCELCGHTTGGDFVKEQYGSAEYLGLCNDGPDLYRYKRKGTQDEWIYEIIKEGAWSSGPMLFTELCSARPKDATDRTSLIKESAWKNKAINKYY